MPKKLLLFLPIFLLMVIFPFKTFAISPDESLEREMKKDGYVSIEKAVKKFEEINNCNVKLPRVPFKSNIKMGIISQDGHLSLKWFNTKEKGQKTFLLFIKKKEDNFKFVNPNNKNYELVKLNDGSSGFYTNDHFQNLVLVKDGLEYSYMIDQDSKLTKKEFIQIEKTFK